MRSRRNNRPSSAVAACGADAVRQPAPLDEIRRVARLSLLPDVILTPGGLPAKPRTIRAGLGRYFFFVSRIIILMTEARCTTRFSRTDLYLVSAAVLIRRSVAGPVTSRQAQPMKPSSARA